VKAFNLRELKNEITLLNPHMAPDIHHITAHMLKKIPRESHLNLLYILNAICRLAYWPTPLKQSKIIMISKPRKAPTDVTSYRPIILLPIISKFLEKLTLKRIYKNSNPQTWIPQHQFGFRKAQYSNAIV
jgi:hypothetical protein